MRLDKYLKVSRLMKRRTVANEACDAGRVSVNGKPARASYDVKIGDVIEIAFGEGRCRIRGRDQGQGGGALYRRSIKKTAGTERTALRLLFVYGVNL